MIYIADPFASTIQSDPVLKYGHNVHINGVSVLRRVRLSFPRDNWLNWSKVPVITRCRYETGVLKARFDNNWEWFPSNQSAILKRWIKRKKIHNPIPHQTRPCVTLRPTWLKSIPLICNFMLKGSNLYPLAPCITSKAKKEGVPPGMKANQYIFLRF